jgi:hypothetical protein
MQSISVGIVVFDSKSEPRSGLCSLAGGNPFRITCIGDLDTSTVWISNLDFEDLFNARLLDNPRLRGNDFFRMKLDRLALEFGLDLDLNLHDGIQQLSAAASRIVNYGSSTYGFTQLQRSLKDSIQQVLLSDNTVFHQTPAVSEAIKNSFLASQRCYGKLNNGISIPLRFSRTWYCRLLLSMPVPNGQWRITGVKFPIENKVNCRSGEGSVVYNFLQKLHNERPFLARISSRSANPNVDRLIDFVDNKEHRDWVPGHEAVNIAFYSDVTLHELLVCDEYTTIDDDPKFRFPHSHISDDMSLSAGVIAENHWVSLASVIKGSGFGGRPKNILTPTASWLRAWDRLFCFKAAYELHKQGYFVRSYGVGTINIHCDTTSDKIKNLISVASQIGLTPPLGIVQMSKFDAALERRLNGN